MSGVTEEGAEVRRDDVFSGLTRIRGFGEAGPLHEMVEVNSDRAKIDLIGQWPESTAFVREPGR